MEKCVLFEVRTEFLNIIQRSFGFKGLMSTTSAKGLKSERIPNERIIAKFKEKWMRHVVKKYENNKCKCWSGNLKEKRLLVRPRSGWKDNIKVNFTNEVVKI
jgi:hypothetical protein